jgi:hypothetical protein
VLLVALLIAAAAAWFFLRTYTSDGNRQCRALYHAARTAADTATVDTTLTPGTHAESDPKTCGFRRSAARWQAR